MKLWYGHGSEHSMNLVMIGRFKDANHAGQAKHLIDRLTERVTEETSAGLIEFDGSTTRYSHAMLDLLSKLNLHTIGPSELAQFALCVNVEHNGTEIEIRTDECDVSAFLKVLIEKGARVEVYSAHDYPALKRDAR